MDKGPQLGEPCEIQTTPQKGGIKCKPPTIVSYDEDEEGQAAPLPSGTHEIVACTPPATYNVTCNNLVSYSEEEDNNNEETE